MKFLEGEKFHTHGLMWFSECGRFLLLSLPVYANTISFFFPYQDSCSCSFLPTFLLFYVAAAPGAAWVYFNATHAVLQFKTAFGLEQSRTESKACCSRRTICLMEQLWYKNLGFSLCLTASVSDSFDPVYPGFENTLLALLGVCSVISVWPFQFILLLCNQPTKGPVLNVSKAAGC